MRALASIFATWALLLLPAAVQAELRAVVAVGTDTGLPGDVPLRYAENDARRFASAMEELGGVSQSRLLTGANAGQLQATLGQVRKDVAAAHGRGERALFFFYYSGHADHDFLHAGRTRVSWDKLRTLVKDVGADVTISFIDACASGGATLAKGARPGEPFSVEREGAKASGTVWFTSSRGDEASFESDELGGSFFTHYLVSALRGSGDLDEDGRVTLNEVYRFAYQQTVGETSLRLKSVQHPTYGFELAGEGDVVLTELKLSQASLVLPRDMSGSFFLARRYGPNRSAIEIAKKAGGLARVGVSEGAYLFYRRDADKIWLATYDIPAGGEVVVEAGDLKARRYEDVVGKGGEISLSTWQVYVAGGGTGPLLDGASITPAGKIGILWRAGWLGIAAEATYSQFGFEAVDTHVDNRSIELLARGEAFWETGIGTFSFGAGLAGLWLSQSPRDAPSQSSLTPGLVLGGAFEHRVSGPLAVRLDASGAGWFLRPAGSSGFSVRLSPRATLGVAYSLR